MCSYLWFYILLLYTFIPPLLYFFVIQLKKKTIKGLYSHFDTWLTKELLVLLANYLNQAIDYAILYWCHKK